MEEQFPMDLAYGKMGVCIYLYSLSRWEGKEEYRQVAEKLLDEVLANISKTKEISVEKGLAGIVIGLCHLVREKFVGGDINEILDEVDSHIFKTLAFMSAETSYLSKSTIIHLLYYLQLRYTEQDSADNKYLFQELIIKMIEMFQQNLKADFFDEPFSFSALDWLPPQLLYVASKIYALNIYSNRITKILEDIIRKVLSTVPALQANRLYLLFALASIRQYLPDHEKALDSHIHLLKERIDVAHIMNVECKEQDVYVKDGLSFVYMLLYLIQKEYPEYGIDFNPQAIYDRIRNSEAWNSLNNREYYHYLRKGLFDGFPGAYLVLLHIKKHFL